MSDTIHLILRRIAVQSYMLLPRLLKSCLGYLKYGAAAQLGSLVYLNCSLHRFSRVQRGAVVVKTVMGMYSYITQGGWVNNAVIGNYVSIGPNVLIGPGTHPVDHISTSPMFYSRTNCFGCPPVLNFDFQETSPVIVGNDVWIGAGAIILDGVNVGNGAIIAAGAVVTQDVPPYAVFGGVPAKLIRYRETLNYRDVIEDLSLFERTPEELRHDVRVQEFLKAQK